MPRITSVRLITSRAGARNDRSVHNGGSGRMIFYHATKKGGFEKENGSK
jgi:hypothetical protein